MASNEGFQGCYVFKSRLQEFAQKVGLTIPVYETIKEGPSHEPQFRSTVIVNDVRYNSLPGFFNRKAAEHSAAEVALIELAKSEEGDKSISMPVHQTGLCKNLLQEYAQKMNFAMPFYECHKEEKPGVKHHLFTCTVDVGGTKYIGATASTKKEAEIKAARTALLAIQSSEVGSNENQKGNAMYTVLPSKKKGTVPGANTQEAGAVLKPKKGGFKKKSRKNKRAGPSGLIQADIMANSLFPVDGFGGQPSDQTNAAQEATMNDFDGNEGYSYSVDGAFASNYNSDPSGAQLAALKHYHCGVESYCKISSNNGDGQAYPAGEIDSIRGVEQDPPMCQGEGPRVVDGMNDTA